MSGKTGIVIIQAQVVREWKDRPYVSRAGKTVEPLVWTLIEQGTGAMPQLMDYNLQDTERLLFGKYAGKTVTLEVFGFRGLWGGRARVDARVVVKPQT